MSKRLTNKLLHKHSLIMLISKRKWKDVHKVLDRNNSSVSRYTLNFALRYAPPIDIVHHIMVKCPEKYFEKDYMDRYPLSTALKYGTNPEVVNYLIHRNKQAAKCVDKEGKTPLHHLFYAYKNNVHNYEWLIDVYMFEIFEILCDFAPESILKEDINGLNVIECALYAEVDIQIIEMLQKKALCTCWKKEII